MAQPYHEFVFSNLLVLEIEGDTPCKFYIFFQEEGMLRSSLTSLNASPFSSKHVD